MADAAVSLAIESIGNFLTQKGKLLFGVRDQVEEMQIELKWMQCFLKDAEARKGESHLVRNWILEIREATYDVEDLIEQFVLRSALRNRKGVANRIKKYVYFIKHAGEFHRMGSGIEAIKTKLGQLRTRLQTYGIRELRAGGEGAPVINRRKRQDYAHVVDHNVVGLDEKITELVQRLLNIEEASVVCIYGMGGLGKTTTGKKVYSDGRVRAHFECFAWVYISQQFNQRQVWESILSQLSDNKEAVRSKSDDELASQLCRLQKEKKCLVVIDDIWQNQDWDKISAAFPYLDTDNRSKILFTTRNGNVVSHGVYRTSLDILDQNTSLELLRSTIIFLGGPNHPIRENSSMDKAIGKMVKECGGLPLAIIVLGGILASKHEFSEWEGIGRNIKLVLKREEKKVNNGVTRVLESSYEDLPYNLKSCFLCFSLYVEDEEIKATELIQRWIGEGFVPASTEETMEDIAEEYLNELVGRCMVQAGSRGHTGRIKTCRMHDLMRDLCISKAKDEGFAHSVIFGVENEETCSHKVSFRRLCISSDSYGMVEEIGGISLSFLQDISPQLRSLCFHLFADSDNWHQAKPTELILRNLKLVRVLDLTSSRWPYRCNDWNEQIGNLIHLRFLKLEVPNFPASICNLRCLQTLNLQGYGTFVVSDSLWRLDRLRHLYLPERCSCESNTQQVGHFRNLQTLENFPPEKFDLQQNLVKFTNVRKLVVSERWGEISEILRTRHEIEFRRLQSLSFMFFMGNMDLEAVTRGSPRLYRLVIREYRKYPSAVIRPAVWPPNLTKLILKDSCLDQSHIGLLGKLQSLRVLFLHSKAFTGKEMIFQKNDFPQLRHLLVLQLSELEAWVVHEGALPDLLCLEIFDCLAIKSVPEGFQFLKQLKELKVTCMPYRFRQKLEQGGEDWDRVKHVPSISFSRISPPYSLFHL